METDQSTVFRNIILGLFVGAWLVFVFLIMIGQKVHETKKKAKDDL